MKKHPAIALKILLLAAWLAGILIPPYSLRRCSASYSAAFDFVFHTHASHVVTHTILYAVLACIIASLLPRSVRATRNAFLVVTACIAAVAAAQEAIQIICEQVPLGSDEIFDFFVDLNGGILGTMLFALVQRRRKSRKNT